MALMTVRSVVSLINEMSVVSMMTLMPVISMLSVVACMTEVRDDLNDFTVCFVYDVHNDLDDCNAHYVHDIVMSVVSLRALVTMMPMMVLNNCDVHVVLDGLDDYDIHDCVDN